MFSDKLILTYIFFCKEIFWVKLLIGWSIFWFHLNCSLLLFSQDIFSGTSFSRVHFFFLDNISFSLWLTLRSLASYSKKRDGTYLTVSIIFSLCKKQNLINSQSQYIDFRQFVISQKTIIIQIYLCNVPPVIMEIISIFVLDLSK